MQPLQLCSFQTQLQQSNQFLTNATCKDPGHCTMIIVICNCILYNINDHSSCCYLPPSPWESKFRVPSNWLKFRRESGEEHKFCYFHILGAYWTCIVDKECTMWMSTLSLGLAATRLPAKQVHTSWALSLLKSQHIDGLAPQWQDGTGKGVWILWLPQQQLS